MVIIGFRPIGNGYRLTPDNFHMVNCAFGFNIISTDPKKYRGNWGHNNFPYTVPRKVRIKNMTLLKNKIFFAVVVVFICCFIIVLYLGMNKIYEKEGELRHSIANTQLLSATSTIDYFFSDIQSKLLFLKSDIRIQEFVDLQFNSVALEKDIILFLKGLVSHSGNVLQAYILDTHGNEILHADKGSLDFGISKDHEHLLQGIVTKETVDLENPVTFIPIIKQGNSNPLILATLSLFDNENSLQGFLILNVDLLLLFKMIPENISIQTSNKDLITVHQGTILNKKVSLKNTDSQGTQISSRRVSETETLHYASVQITGNQYLTIIKHHRHAPLSILFKKIIVQTGIIIVIFLGFVAVLSLSTVSRIKEQIKANKTLIHALIALTDWRDPETGDHLNRTRKYSVILAEKILESDSRQRISNEFIANIFEAAPLHDIGKVGIKDSILLKPGKFTDQEFEEMKKHVVIGKLIILDLMKRLSSDQPVLKMALNICECHHERFDGTGYPRGLAGDVIPFEARIFAVADVYDALRSHIGLIRKELITQGLLTSSSRNAGNILILRLWIHLWNAWINLRISRKKVIWMFKLCLSLYVQKKQIIKI